MGVLRKYFPVQVPAVLVLMIADAITADGQTAPPAASDFRVTLLGTSTPNRFRIDSDRAPWWKPGTKNWCLTAAAETRFVYGN